MRFKVVALGEVLWDLLPSGPQLGGAPANLACHVAGLGGQAKLISRVGNDALGRQAREQLAARGVDVGNVATDPTAPTGTVSVEIDSTGQPHFTIHEEVAWDRLAVDSGSLQAVAAADAVCFGTLAQRTPAARAAIQTLLAAAPDRLILCDINLRAPFCDRVTIEGSLRAANALKLNETELPLLARMFGFVGDPSAQAEALANRFGLRVLILTLGAAGSRVWQAGEWTTVAGETVAVRDTVGAGDSFTAAFVLGYLLGWPMKETVRAATGIAAYVCSQSGATPVLPPELAAKFLRAAVSRISA
jgi:fructokinase